MLTRAIASCRDRLTALADRDPDPARLATAAVPVLTSVLDAPGLLTAAQREPNPDHYRQHVLHVDPAGRFSIVALVWLPGQATPIHDHVSWCVTGVHTGSETEQRFVADADRRLLRPAATVVNGPGSVSCLARPDRDIHRVTCAGERAVSIHLYGADIARLGGSINVVYAEELVAS